MYGLIVKLTAVPGKRDENDRNIERERRQHARLRQLRASQRLIG